MSVASRGSASSSAGGGGGGRRRRPPPIPTDEINACDHEREMMKRTTSRTSSAGTLRTISTGARSFVDQSQRTLLAPDLPAAPAAVAPSPPFPTSGRTMRTTTSSSSDRSRRRPNKSTASSVGSSSTGTRRVSNARMLPPSSAANDNSTSSSRGEGGSTSSSRKKVKGGKKKKKKGAGEDGSRGGGSSNRSATSRRSRSSAASSSSSDPRAVVGGQGHRSGQLACQQPRGKKSLLRVKLTLLSLDGIVVASNNANANAGNKENHGGGGSAQHAGGGNNNGNNTFGKRKPYRNDYWNNAARRPPPPVTAVASVVTGHGNVNGTTTKAMMPPTETHLPSRSMNIPRPTPSRPSIGATAVWDADSATAGAAGSSSSSVSGGSVKTDDSTDAPPPKAAGTSLVLERLVERTVDVDDSRDTEDDDDDGLVEIKLSLLRVGGGGGSKAGQHGEGWLPLGLVSFCLSGREREETEIELPVDPVTTRHDLDRFANLGFGGGGGSGKTRKSGGMFGFKKKKDQKKWGSLVPHGGEDDGGGAMSFSFPDDPSGRTYAVAAGGGATLRVRVEVTSGDGGGRRRAMTSDHRVVRIDATGVAVAEAGLREAAGAASAAAEGEDGVPTSEGVANHHPREATTEIDGTGSTSTPAEGGRMPSDSFREEEGSTMEEAAVECSATSPTPPVEREKEKETETETERTESSPTRPSGSYRRRQENDSSRAPAGSPVAKDDRHVSGGDIIESIIERYKKSMREKKQHSDFDDDDSLLEDSTEEEDDDDLVDDYCVEVQTDGIDVETVTSGVQYVQYAPVTPSPQKKVRKKPNFAPTSPIIREETSPIREETQENAERKKESPTRKRSVTFDPEIEVPKVEIWKEESTRSMVEEESTVGETVQQQPEASMLDKFLGNVGGNDPLVKTVLRQASTLDKMLESMERKLWAGDDGVGDEATEVTPRHDGEESTLRSSPPRRRRNLDRDDSGYSWDDSYRSRDDSYRSRDDEEEDDYTSDEDDEYSCASSITYSSDIPDGKSIGSLSLLEVEAAKSRLHRYARRAGVDVQDLV